MPDKFRNRQGETNFDHKRSRAVSRSSIYTETKKCANCTRQFQRRKKWTDNMTWSAVKYCSDRCRIK